MGAFGQTMTKCNEARYVHGPEAGIRGLRKAYTGKWCNQPEISTSGSPKTTAYLGKLYSLVAVKRILRGRHRWTALPSLCAKSGGTMHSSVNKRLFQQEIRRLLLFPAGRGKGTAPRLFSKRCKVELLYPIKSNMSRTAPTVSNRITRSPGEGSA